jgi:hypothetical protein
MLKHCIIKFKSEIKHHILKTLVTLLLKKRHFSFKCCIKITFNFLKW